MASASRCGVLGGVVIAVITIGAAAGSAQRSHRPSTAQGEWPTYGGDVASSKYSPLDQINASNFAQLRVAWRVKTPDAVLSMTLPGGAEWTASSAAIFAELNRIDPKRWRDGQPPFVANFKATPLMVGGTLYLNSPLSVGAAYDAKSGAMRWIYNPKSYEAGTTTMSARWNQRGVAYWTDGNEERIYWGTGDGYLISVDAKTGRPTPGFGTNGRVDLMEGLPRTKRGERDYLNALTYSVQSPPFVVGDIVVTPASISSLVSRKEQIPGWIRAFDARTGKVKWTFKTIPSPGEFGGDTWENDSASYSGKVTVWSMLSADEELGHLYAPTNTIAPDYYGGHRLGNNLFAETVLALDLATGRRVWHFQTVHHGLWDYDNPAAPNLIDIMVDGKRIKALAQITKQGFVYTFDRVTGAPVWPIEERPALASNVPGERAAPTQPFPTQTGGVRIPRGDARRPHRLHAGDPRHGGQGRAGVYAGSAVHAANDRRDDTAAGHGWRRQLVWRGCRSRNRDALCPVAPGLERESRGPTGARVEQQPPVRPAPTKRSADASRTSIVQTALFTDDRHRHEHRHARVADSNRQR